MKEGMRKFRKIGLCSGAYLRAGWKQTDLRHSRLQLLQAAARLQLRLLVPGAVRRCRQRGLALHGMQMRG